MLNKTISYPTIDTNELIDRDKLWCEALLNTLHIVDVEKVLHWFNEAKRMRTKSDE